jgi:diguanylate cyclase (GGDEF)-like protein/PAS domain S-box-containing protein
MHAPRPGLPVTDASRTSLRRLRLAAPLASAFVVVSLADILVSPVLRVLPLTATWLHGPALALLTSTLLWLLALRPILASIRADAAKSRAILDAAPEGILEVAREGRIQSVNEHACRMFGYSREELLGKEIELLIPQSARDAHVRHRKSYEANPYERPMGVRMELVARRRNGEELPVEVSLNSIGMGDKSRRNAVVICIVRDVSRQREARNEIVQINSRLEHSLRMHEALTAQLRHMSEFGELLQSCFTLREVEPVAGAMWASLFPGCSGAILLATASRTALERVVSWGTDLSSPPVIPLTDCWALRRGKLHTSETMPCSGCGMHVGADRICVPMSAQGEMIGVLHLESASSAAAGESSLELISAITERIGVAITNLRFRDVLKEQAMIDPLTGLYNRRFLEEYLELELLRAARCRRPFALLMLDADHFKRFNDTFGHQAGDVILREIAQVLRNQTPPGGMACRFGGEELIVVCPETSLDEAMARAERIRQAVESLVVSDHGQPLGKVTVSIGVAAAPSRGASATELLQAADKALYQAKHNGRNRIVCSTIGETIEMPDFSLIPAR